MVPFLLSLACLMMIAYQDFRQRAVLWLLFPALLAALLWLAGKAVLSPGYGTGLVYNIAFLLVQGILLTGYISLRQKRLANLTQHHLGWGDILFLLVAAFYFSPLNFFLFYVAGLVTALLGMLLYRLLTRRIDTVPLAGILALLFMALLITDRFSDRYSARADQWIINLLQHDR